MPQCRSAESLQKICLRTVGKNMNFWCKDLAENYKVMKNYKYFIGPFDDLSSEVSNMLLEHLMDTRNLQRPYLHSLINHSLVTLDFSGCPMLVNDHIINVVLLRCKNLKSINLSNCIQVKNETLVALAEAYPNLGSLNLNGTKCMQEAAKAVFRNCTEVKELILSHCMLEDDDLLVLINSVKEKETHRNLRKFSLISTNVTHQALSLVLKNLPWITILEHEGLAKSIYFTNKELNQISEHDLNDTEIKQQDLKTFQLRSLVLDETYIFSNILASILKVCPYLVKVELIQVFGYNNDCFPEMAHLTMLRNLTVVCNPHTTVDFSGVVQALETIGTNLQNLVLENVDGTDILKIAKLCPNVIELTLGINDDKQSFYSELHKLNSDYKLEEIHLTKLKKLKLEGCGEEDSSEEEMEPVLTRFLSACQMIESLTMIQLGQLTDAVLHGTLKTNQMTHLSSLQIICCKNVTNDSLRDLILSPNNKLDSVRVMDCWNISQQDYSEWREIARENNYDVNIDWN